MLLKRVNNIINLKIDSKPLKAASNNLLPKLLGAD